MTREEHNLQWGVNRLPTDAVLCHTFGYGELSQYDALCPACWLGNSHTWERHDWYVLAIREQDAQRQIMTEGLRRAGLPLAAKEVNR